ncbi:MAG TPA: c-type cytochrome [Usitatibacter sp.]|nr:c-type cytochrome [Usitatibacter sp.]
MSLPRIFAAVAACAAMGAVAQSPAPAKVAGNAAAGKNKVYECQGCHGIADWKTAFPEVYRVPKLGGQKPEYLVAAMKAYKNGERDFATMRGMVADLSDQDMADIAAYYGANGPAVVAEKK